MSVELKHASLKDKLVARKIQRSVAHPRTDYDTSQTTQKYRKKTVQETDQLLKDNEREFDTERKSDIKEESKNNYPSMSLFTALEIFDQSPATVAFPLTAVDDNLSVRPKEKEKSLISNITAHVSSLVNSILWNTRFSSPAKTLSEKQEFVVDGVTYRLMLERVGQSELLQAVVNEWMKNLDQRDIVKIPFPPRYKDRLERINQREFVEKYYGPYLSAGVLYRDQISKIDPELMNNIIKYYNDKSELNKCIPKISSRIDNTLKTLSENGIDKKKLKSLYSTVLRRD